MAFSLAKFFSSLTLLNFDFSDISLDNISDWFLFSTVSKTFLSLFLDLNSLSLTSLSFLKISAKKLNSFKLICVYFSSHFKSNFGIINPSSPKQKDDSLAFKNLSGTKIIKKKSYYKKLTN